MNNILYPIALSFVPEVGIKTMRQLLQHFGDAETIFKTPIAQLKKINGIGETRAKNFNDKTVFQRAEKELQFIEKEKIEMVFFNDKLYPKRLLQCNDAPILLYKKGKAQLNADKTIAIIGTRKNTDYGQRVTEQLVDELKQVEGLMIISGLASGIDAVAHKACVKSSIPTLGVLGHSLDRIYPFTHKKLAEDMLEQGGLLSEFPSGTKPDRQNFPVRNRIVAGMSDVTVVVESDIKGGAMITAYMALSYNRDVMAFPGRLIDSKSIGTNHLIKKNMAAMITAAQDLLELMNWDAVATKKKVTQQQLFLNLSEEEQCLIKILEDKEKLHADELLSLTGFKLSQLASVLLQLEMQGLVKTLPGKFYRLD